MVSSTLVRKPENRSNSRKENSGTLRVDVFSTELGWFATAGRKVSGRGNVLASLTFGHRSATAAVDYLLSTVDLESEPFAKGSWNPRLAKKLTSYAAGKAVDFDQTPLDLSHLTPFQQSVAGACRQIPCGETLTYGQLAQIVGSPNAARAVGNVMRTNRIPLIIPCHRVVGANGKLVGFSAPDGLRMKERLLAMEAGVAR